jgi:selenocysteine-specific elongation factor
VGGIDLAILVVAANEGVMPQTREHLAILDLLEIRNGIAVITKKDIVDDELLELVNMEVEELVPDDIIKFLFFPFRLYQGKDCRNCYQQSIPCLRI